MNPLETMLRFYFITDDGPAACTPLEQVRIALAAGATAVQYRNKQFGLHAYREVRAIRELCHDKTIPLIINDNVLLAKAVEADGVHLGQEDETPELARRILGPRAIIGLSAANDQELGRGGPACCDYVGSGPVFGTKTKADAKPTLTLNGLEAVVRKTALPVVAIGGITAENAGGCFAKGAAGVAVISAVTRSANPEKAARDLAVVCLQTRRGEKTGPC